MILATLVTIVQSADLNIRLVDLFAVIGMAITFGKLYQSTQYNRNEIARVERQNKEDVLEIKQQNKEVVEDLKERTDNLENRVLGTIQNLADKIDNAGKAIHEMGHEIKMLVERQDSRIRYLEKVSGIED